MNCEFGSCANSERTRVRLASAAGSGPAPPRLSLSKLYSRHGPLAFVSRDGNPKAVEFVQPNFFHGPGFAIGQYNAFADKVGLRLLVLGKDF